jgi:hypothetical protein
MRDDEVARLVQEARRFASAHPRDVEILTLVTGLLSDAARDEASAAVVASALAAATEATRRRRPDALPASERRLWEHVGARFEPSAIARVEAARAALFADLVQRSLIGDAATAELLGVDRSRISQRVSDRSIYAFSASGDDRCFPRWQFTGTKTLPGFKTVVTALAPDLHPLTVDHWFTTPNTDLEVDGTPAAPVTWLATGGSPMAAAELARDL